MKIIFCVILLSSLFFIGTGTQANRVTEQRNDKLGVYLQVNFEDYIEESKRWIKDNRAFITEDHVLEIALNSPYELKPNLISTRGVLLVHGLSDSPYSFIDIAKSLKQQGLLVRTILLPGHGSKPADLMLPTIEDWQLLIKHHTQLLAKEVDELWLGGFSTGANLVTSAAIANPDINGLLLFSPAFASQRQLVSLAPLAANFIDWADIDEENNITRYNSLAMNGAALYYQSAQIVQEELKNTVYSKPVFVMISDDSVIDTNLVREYFSTQFSHPGSRMVWYGSNGPKGDRVSQFDMILPESRISNGSHMGVLYSPDNPLYGKKGTIRICSNGQPENLEEKCNQGMDVWFSSWGYRSPNKVHARLTWNPYFKESMNIMQGVMNNSIGRDNNEN